MELGWPRNTLVILVLAAPSQWEGQEKIWISLASAFIDNLK